MKNYKIILRSSGTVTQLPDSQKIFGAMVTELSRMQGGEAAAEFVRKVYNREAHLALSNLFPLGFLPVPQDYIMEKFAERLSEEKKPEENLKKLRAQIRERAYIREEKLNFILENREHAVLSIPISGKFPGSSSGRPWNVAVGE